MYLSLNHMHRQDPAGPQDTTRKSCLPSNNVVIDLEGSTEIFGF